MVQPIYNTNNNTMKNTLSNEVIKNIGKQSYYDAERFTADAKRYIKAIKEGRMINSIGSVSNSGMSRTIKFVEMNKLGKQCRIYNFFVFFKVMGYTPVKQSDYFRINGCGMDMIFATNYNIIHNLHRMRFMNKAQCNTCAQMTPSTI